MNMVTTVKGRYSAIHHLTLNEKENKEGSLAGTGYAHAVKIRAVSNSISGFFHSSVCPNFEHYYRHLLQLLLWPKLVCMSTLLLAAVSGSGG